MAYKLSTIVAFLSWRSLDGRVCINQGEWCQKSQMVMAIIANGKFVGNGNKIAPDADIADGAFQVCCVLMRVVSCVLIA